MLVQIPERLQFQVQKQVQLPQAFQFRGVGAFRVLYHKNRFLHLLQLKNRSVKKD